MVCVYLINKLVQILIIQLKIGVFESFPELIFAQNSIIVFIEFFEGFYHFFLFLVSRSLVDQKHIDGLLHFRFWIKIYEILHHLFRKLPFIKFCSKPRVSKSIFCWNSIFGIFSEHFTHQILRLVRNLFKTLMAEIIFTSFYRSNYFFVIITVKWRITG